MTKSKGPQPLKINYLHTMKPYPTYKDHIKIIITHQRKPIPGMQPAPKTKNFSKNNQSCQDLEKKIINSYKNRQVQVCRESIWVLLLALPERTMKYLKKSAKRKVKRVGLINMREWSCSKGFVMPTSQKIKKVAHHLHSLNLDRTTRINDTSRQLKII